MIEISWQNIQQEVRGMLIMLFGIVLLLHTLNILQKWLNWILIGVSIAMIVYGFVESRSWKRIIKITTEKKTKNDDTQPSA